MTYSLSMNLPWSSKNWSSGIPISLELTGGEYKTWERIHLGISDPRLLAIPTSWGRVSAPNPNWGSFWRLAPGFPIATRCSYHCIVRVAQDIKGTCWPGVILTFPPAFWALTQKEYVVFCMKYMVWKRISPSPYYIQYTKYSIQLFVLPNKKLGSLAWHI